METDTFRTILQDYTASISIFDDGLKDVEPQTRTAFASHRDENPLPERTNSIGWAHKLS